MKSNVVCTLVWSRSNSATAGIGGLPSSSAWTTYRGQGSARTARTGLGTRPHPQSWRRTQAGGKKTPEVISRIEELMRHDTAGDPITGGEVEPAHDAQDRRRTRRFGHRREQEHSGPLAQRHGLQAPREPQADRLHQKPRSQSTVPLHGAATRTICQPRPSHHQCRYEEEGTNWQLQKY